MSAYAHARECFLAAVARERMSDLLSGGALLALSGGKDSVLLFSLFADYAKEKGIPFSAFHLNHGIRGAEADADERFCASLSQTLGVPFFSARSDIPALAAARGEGIEEAARRERYAVLTAKAKELGYTAVLTAHTATDLAETVLLQALRGGGIRALCGIPPVRELKTGIFVLRPLLALTQEEVLAALSERSLPFVTDSTNADNAYARNYLRAEILPRLSRLTPVPEHALSRLAENLREDAALLDDLAKDAYARLLDGELLDGEGLLALPASLRFRVLRLFHAEMTKGAPVPERTHVCALFARMEKEGDFSFSLPGGVTLRRTGGRLCFGDAPVFRHPRTPIRMGCNRLFDGATLWVLDESTTPPPANVYTLSTQKVLAFATIEGELYVRSREEGDAYRYGGITHKLKKVLNDKKISRTARSRLPVLCDDKGILWVPHLEGRDDGTRARHPLTVLYLAGDQCPDALTDAKKTGK